MKSILALTLISVALSIDVVFVGDSRMYLIAHHMFGFSDDPNVLPYIATGQPVYAHGNSYHFVAMPGARVYDFAYQNTLGQALNTILSNSYSGAYVCLWLGLNNLGPSYPNGIQDTFTMYYELAKSYPHLKFVIFSLAGVIESLSRQLGSEVTNAYIKSYNFQMMRSVNQYPLPNLKYVNLMNGLDPMVTSEKYTIAPYLYDGMNLTRDGCIYFFNRFLGSLNF